MRFAGFQSLSLLDYPGRSCAILFTQGCPFRCSYCHNPDLLPVGEGSYSADVLLERLRRHRGMVDAVCITGGEPTVHPDLVSFLREVKAEGFSVKLDTNGIHPRVVRTVIEERLADYLAMDLKHVWERYADVIRVAGDVLRNNCMESFRLIQDSGVPHEFRTTIAPGIHALDDFTTMAGYLRPGETYAVQTFRTGKTLVADLPTAGFDADAVVSLLRPLFPSLILEAR